MLRDNKWGRFTILGIVGTQAAGLDLPRTSRVHPVISVLHLQPFVEDTFSRRCTPPPSATIDGVAAWELERIFKERRRGKRTEFKVKWIGYPDTEFTLEPEENLRQDLGSVAPHWIEEYRATQRATVRAAIPTAVKQKGRTVHFDNRDHPVYFISQVLKLYEENYTILELEMAGVVWAILKFQRYLDGSVFTIVTDHQSILSIGGHLRRLCTVPGWTMENAFGTIYGSNDPSTPCR